jgi:hypothetical protein
MSFANIAELILQAISTVIDVINLCRNRKK